MTGADKTTLSDLGRFAGLAFPAALVALWAVDAAVNLRSLERAFLDGEVQEGLLDYIGLFVSETQVAFLLVVCSFAGALLLETVLRRGRSVMERLTRTWTAVLSALTAALVVFGQTYIVWGASELVLWTRSIIGALVGLLLLGVMYPLVARSNTNRPDFDFVLALLIYPAFILALANVCLFAVRNGEWLSLWIHGLAWLVTAAAAVWTLARKTNLKPSAWSPVATACFFALLSIRAAGSYGTLDAQGAQDPAPGKLDIVLIVLDTVRADHLELYGYERDTMPLLAKWAQSATTFTRATAPAGWTSPSHASMFSGATVSQHGVHYSSDPALLSTAPIEGISWLPEILGKRGYYNLAVTANGVAIPEGITGFDQILAPHRGRWSWGTVAALADNESPVLQRVAEWFGWRMPYADADATVDTVVRAAPSRAAPVFLFVNLMDAHAPYNPPPAALRDLGLTPSRPFERYSVAYKISRDWDLLPDDKHDALVDLYDGGLRGMDEHLFRLLQWIDSHFGDDTVVIVTSDHGEELGEGGRVGHEYGLSQSLLHVPLVVRAPFLSTEEIDAVVTVRNLYGFIEAIARGAELHIEDIVRPDEFGVIAERYPSRSTANLLGETYFRAWVSMIEGDVKVVGPTAFGLEVFDARGPWLAGEQPIAGSQASQDLTARIDEYWENHRDRRENTDAPILTEEELRRLRALGYIR